jgi:hypothetical protein
MIRRSHIFQFFATNHTMDISRNEWLMIAVVLIIVYVVDQFDRQQH